MFFTFSVAACLIFYLAFIYKLQKENSVSANPFLNHFIRFQWINSQGENMPASTDNKQKLKEMKANAYLHNKSRKHWPLENM